MHEIWLYAPAIVKEFQDAFETSKDPALWEKLVAEETDELDQALGNGNRVDILKELCDAIYVDAGHTNVDSAMFLPIDLEERFKSVVRRAFELFDIDVIEEAFSRVHASNMSKLGEDGKPVRREDGKILKGPNYKPPFLDDLVKEAA